MATTPSTCFSVLRLPAIRVTAVSACGAPLTGACTSAVSAGLTTLTMTVEQEDRQDYFTLTADAQPCITDTAPPVLKWINVQIDFCRVDPTILSLVTGEPLVLDDSAAPVAIGWDTSVGSVNTVNFSLEGWTRIAGKCGANGQVLYGYTLLPWNIEGVLGDVTYQNGAVTFSVMTRTQAGSLWGTGPYSVVTSNATATTGMPLPLLTAIGPNVHRRLFVTTLAPPTEVCGCTALPNPTLSIVAGSAQLATLTLPVPSVLPAMIAWGDSSAPQLVTTGTTVTHTYPSTGTYAVRLAPTGASAPAFNGSVTTHP